MKRFSAQPDISQIMIAGTKCDNRVNTFCSRKISSHCVFDFLTIRVTTLRIIVLAIKLASQLRRAMENTITVTLRNDAKPLFNPASMKRSFNHKEGSEENTIFLL